jgi:hypothetical protein
MHEKLILHGIRYRPNYKIAISETISQWTDKKQELLDLITSLGFIVVKEPTSNRFLYINAIKPLISLI